MEDSGHGSTGELLIAATGQEASDVRRDLSLPVPHLRTQYNNRIQIQK